MAKAVVSSQGSTTEGSISKPIYVLIVLDRLQFFKGCWIEGLSFPLAVGWRPFQCFATWVFPRWQFASSRPARQSATKREVTIFCNNESNSHNLYHIVLVINKSLGSVHIQGKRIIQRCEFQEAGINGGLFRSLSTLVWFQLYLFLCELELNNIISKEFEMYFSF